MGSREATSFQRRSASSLPSTAGLPSPVRAGDRESVVETEEEEEEEVDPLCVGFAARRTGRHSAFLWPLGQGLAQVTSTGSRDEGRDGPCHSGRRNRVSGLSFSESAGLPPPRPGFEKRGVARTYDGGIFEGSIPAWSRKRDWHRNAVPRMSTALVVRVLTDLLLEVNRPISAQIIPSDS